MKKLFTLFVAGAAMLSSINANAGSALHGNLTNATVAHTGSNTRTFSDAGTRALTCDTLFNVSFAHDTPVIYLLDSPYYYYSGNGAIQAGPTSVFPVSGVAEMFAGTAGHYVTTGVVFFAPPTIKSTDSATPVKVYVYDANGTQATPNGGVAPGTKLDSASTTLGAIAQYAGANLPMLLSFTHNVALPSNNFFVGVEFPLITGDTVLVYTNTEHTQYGHAFLQVSAGGQRGFASYDTVYGVRTGLYIGARTCVNTSITNISGVSDLNVYPNPSFGKVNVAFNMESASDVAISVTSITGSKVYEAAEKAVSVYNKSLDLSGVAPGVYIVNIKTATGTINRRVSIQ